VRMHLVVAGLEGVCQLAALQAALNVNEGAAGGWCRINHRHIVIKPVCVPGFPASCPQAAL
jgi:hypothetical protein